MNNNEILFRGKKKSTITYVGTDGCANIINGLNDGEWEYGMPLICKKFTHIIPIDKDGEDWSESVPIDPDTLGQFVGQMDKTGKRVFSGDIVRTKYGRLCIVVRIALPMHNGWDLKPFNADFQMPDEWDLWNSNNIEVVGNVYDTPKPMNGK